MLLIQNEMYSRRNVKFQHLKCEAIPFSLEVNFKMHKVEFSSKATVTVKQMNEK